MLLTRKTLLLAVCYIFGSITLLKAQQYKALPQSIFEVLEVQEGENIGEVVINQPSRLLSLVGRVSPRYGRILAGESNAQVVYGYRIVYFNSNAPKAKAIAYARQEKLKDIAPEYPTYIHFNAPFWRLQLGDFPSREEAREVLRKLNKDLPYWQKEAYIVRDRIRLIK